MHAVAGLHLAEAIVMEVLIINPAIEFLAVPFDAAQLGVHVMVPSRKDRKHPRSKRRYVLGHVGSTILLKLWRRVGASFLFTGMFADMTKTAQV